MPESLFPRAYFILLPLSYLLGSIPGAYIIGRMHSLDIRKIGSGNVGATNITRALGKKWGKVTFLIDFSKGTCVAFICRFLLARNGHISHFSDNIFNLSNSGQFFVLVSIIVAVIGHAFPIWLNFKGGKGIAVTGGLLLVYFPLVLLIAVGMWMLIFFISKYVSLASIITALSLPFVIVAISIIRQRSLSGIPVLYFLLGTLIAIFITYLHRSNIKNILAGTEYKFVKKS